METAIVSVICIVLIMLGGMTMSQGFLSSVDSSTLGLEEISERDEEIMRTELSTVNAAHPSADIMTVRLENSGQTKLNNFARWDVIVQYFGDGGSYYTKWLPYTEGTLGDNEWKVSWIHLDGETEVFEPNILNPGEEIKIMARLDPSVGEDTTSLVVVSTPNGIPASINFSR